MGFIYENFKSVGFNHPSSPAVFSYYTTDRLGQVVGDSYFSDPRASLSVGDVVHINSRGKSRAAVAVNSNTVRFDQPTGMNIIDSPDVLPSAVDGVITLSDFESYLFTSDIDLEGFRLVGGQSSVIVGVNAESCFLRSSGLSQGTALVSSNYTLPIQNITLDSATIFNLDASANPSQALDWGYVNLVNSSDIGVIRGYNNFIGNVIGFLGVSGLVLDGTFGTIGFSDTIFVGQSTGTIITLPSTAEITRRYRTRSCAFVVFGSGIGVNVDLSASIPDESYIIDKCNFSGGGTYLSGVANDADASNFTDNKGIANTNSSGGYFVTGNSSATSISQAGVAVKANATTTAKDFNQRFSHSNNRLTCTSPVERRYEVKYTLSLSSGNNNQVGAYIAKNGVEIDSSETYLTTNSGGRLENATVMESVNLVDGDYVELFVENRNATIDIIVEDINCLVKP